MYDARLQRRNPIVEEVQLWSISIAGNEAIHWPNDGKGLAFDSKGENDTAKERYK